MKDFLYRIRSKIIGIINNFPRMTIDEEVDTYIMHIGIEVKESIANILSEECLSKKDLEKELNLLSNKIKFKLYYNNNFPILLDYYDLDLYNTKISILFTPKSNKIKSNINLKEDILLDIIKVMRRCIKFINDLKECHCSYI